MQEARTTTVVQLYLDELQGHAHQESVDPVVRDLLGRSSERLHALCSSMLHRSYPRLARPPLSLVGEDVLSGVVERLMKALREARPGNVRQFFALANRHMRWELNEFARRLDGHSAVRHLAEEPVAAPVDDDAEPGPNTARVLEAIDALPEEEREVFDLIRIQGLSHAEAADVLSVSTKTVQRRLHSALLQLTDALGDLSRGDGGEAAPDE